MKTYAVSTTPQEFRDKLVKFYRNMGEITISQLNTLHLKRDRTRIEIQSKLYFDIALELEKIEIVENPPKTFVSATYL